MLTNVKAVLFDLDGTLIDSMWMWKDIDIEYLQAHGVECPSDLQACIEGMSFPEIAAYFKERFGVPGTLEEIQREWVEMAKYKYAHKVPLKSGAACFLDYLKRQGIRTGIATSNSRELLEAVLLSLGLQERIDYAITCAEAGIGKPAPDVYLKAAAQLGAKPEECLIFEDTPTGIQAGLNAGIRVCAVEDAYSADRKSLILKLAHYYITDFDQITDHTYETLR